MRNWLLFVLLISLTHCASAQQGYLFVKKGIKKKRTYAEGDGIRLRGTDGYLYSGVITLLKNDTIYINGLPLARTAVSQVLLGKRKKKFHIDPKQLLLITGGAALVTAGLTLSKQASFGESLKSAAVIGYGPIAVSWIASKISFKRRKFRIGRRFRLQIIDFHLPYKAF